MARIAVLGAGVMGSALTFPLSDNGHQVNLIGTHLDDSIIASCRQCGKHPRLGDPLPPTVSPFFYSEIAAGLDRAEVILLGVSSRGVRWAGQVLSVHLRKGQPVIMVAKGLDSNEQGDLRTLCDLLADQLPPTIRNHAPIAAIAGPSIAAELAGRRQTCVVFTSREAEVLSDLRSIFATGYYQIWTSTDLVGVEVCAALKNTYTLAVSLVAGLSEKSGGPDRGPAMHNHAASLFAQSLVEMGELGRLLGGNIEAVIGLPGAGDLYVTCQAGRNARMGRLLGMGLTPQAATEQLAGETVEGVDTVAVVATAVEKLIARGVLASNALPLLRQIYAVAIKGKPVNILFQHFFVHPL